jgi:hypothetical protein
MIMDIIEIIREEAKRLFSDNFYRLNESSLQEESYYSEEGIIKLYHRVGTKNYTIETLPDLIKSVEQKGLVINDNGEIGNAIWFSNDFNDYGKNGIFVVALNFDTATNGVTNNKYGMLYEGHNAYAYENIPFEDLEIIKIPVGVIGRDHVLTSDKAIEYINADKFLTPDAIRSGEFIFRPFVDAFNKYVQPYINIPDFLIQSK